MQLRFLGQAYSTSDNQVETTASEHTARFLGQSYTTRRPVKTSNSQLGRSKISRCRLRCEGLRIARPLILPVNASLIVRLVFY